jgi:predicted Zn finger-like uncharacterized protein
MYSQCPECHARFRVTAEVLRVARGTVRCGRCGNAFDALERLSDTVPPARVPADERPPDRGAIALSAVPDAIVAAEYHFTADDLEKVFIDAQDWQKQFGPEEVVAPADQGSAADDASSVVVDESEPFEDITLEGERISIEVPPGFDDDELVAADVVGEPDVERLVESDIESDTERDIEHDRDSTDEFEILDVPESAGDEDRAQTLDYLLTPEPEAAPEPEPVPVPALASDLASDREPEPAVVPLAAQRWRRMEDAAADTPIVASRDESPVREGSGWRTLGWSLGCLLLLAGLLAQVAHYYRQDLIRHPALGDVLREVYGRLGAPLSPNWDLAAYELRRWGDSSDTATDDRMTIRASLTNRAAFAQPHPILRLELDDRYGESIAVRDLEPAEYLKNPTEASRLLAPSASTEAEILILNPGPDSVGYRLDVCLRESPTQLRCAQGPG